LYNRNKIVLKYYVVIKRNSNVPMGNNFDCQNSGRTSEENHLGLREK